MYSVSEEGDGQVTLLASVLGQSDILIHVDLITTVQSAACELKVCIFYTHHNYHEVYTGVIITSGCAFFQQLIMMVESSLFRSKRQGPRLPLVLLYVLRTMTWQNLMKRFQ